MTDQLRSTPPSAIPADGIAARVEVVVVGGGTMGVGIVQCLIEAGAVVTVVEPNAHPAATLAGRVGDGIRRRLKGSEELEVQLETLVDRIEVRPDLPAGRSPALVIEAVPESPTLKAEVLTAIDVSFPHTELVASNTSSLSIDALAAATTRPDRFLGMHFFNPVPRSELVELVVGSETAPEVTTLAARWVERLGKESIEVRDSPGFATSRLGLVIGLEAIRMVEEGVASAEDIDRGMVLGYKFPVGPLRLTDIVGLDVRLAIAEHLAGSLGPRFEPPALLRQKVRADELGQKSGKGFYAW